MGSSIASFARSSSVRSCIGPATLWCWSLGFARNGNSWASNRLLGPYRKSQSPWFRRSSLSAIAWPGTIWARFCHWRRSRLSPFACCNSQPAPRSFHFWRTSDKTGASPCHFMSFHLWTFQFQIPTWSYRRWPMAGWAEICQACRTSWTLYSSWKVRH